MAVVARKRKRTTTYYVVLPVGGRQTWEKSGTDRRAAERLETKRKREIATGTYQGPDSMSRATKVAAYADRWGKARTNRSADADRQRLRDHVVSRAWFASLRLDDVQPSHLKRLVDELAAGGMPGKTISNVYGVTRTMLRDARIDGLIQSDPCVLPRGYIKRDKSAKREPYTRREALALTTDARVAPDRRVFNALALYLGMREGEVCGRRWRDWDREAAPLGAMTIATQYGGEPLKTGRPRRAPVHPALAAILTEWWDHGFELLYTRRPTQDDFIVPMRVLRANHHGVRPHHTKSSAYKAFRAACLQAEVPSRSLHATRHTMITWARRGGARKDVLERVTHNAVGDIVDQYTHWDWDPLCEAVACISYVDAHQAVHRMPETPQKPGATGVQIGTRNATESRGFAAIHETSIPSASTTNSPVAKGEHETRQPARQRGAIARWLREAVALATLPAPPGAEDEVVRRLRRVAKALPRTSEPTRRAAPPPPLHRATE